MNFCIFKFEIKSKTLKKIRHSYYFQIMFNIIAMTVNSKHSFLYQHVFRIIITLLQRQITFRVLITFDFKDLFVKVIYF